MNIMAPTKKKRKHPRRPRKPAIASSRDKTISIRMSPKKYKVFADAHAAHCAEHMLNTNSYGVGSILRDCAIKGLTARKSLKKPFIKFLKDAGEDKILYVRMSPARHDFFVDAHRDYCKLHDLNRNTYGVGSLVRDCAFEGLGYGK